MDLTMNGFESQDEQYIEFGKRIRGIDPVDLHPNDYLNLETESGSRYVFRVLSADEEDGVFIEFVSGKKALKGAWGKLADKRIQLGDELNFEGGNTTDLAGIILTHGGAYEYPVSILKYNEFLEELDFTQVNDGDHVYMIAEDGQTYVAQIISTEGKKPKIQFVAGRNHNDDTEGEIKIMKFKVGMRFRNTVRSTMPIKAMFVLPDLDNGALDYLDQEYRLPEAEYETELERLYLTQIKNGEFVRIKTANSIYILKINEIGKTRAIFKIVDGTNNFVTEAGVFLDGKIRTGRRWKFSNGRTTITTTPVESIILSEHYAPGEFGAVEAMRESFEERQQAVMNHPNMNTNPGIWIGAVSGLHKQEIFEALALDPRDLTIGSVQAAWKKFDAENNPSKHMDLIPYRYNQHSRWYGVIKEQYERMIGKLEAIGKILEED